jgi:thiaminase
MAFSLTSSLLSSNEEGFQKATRSPFLKLAAQGRLSKETLGEWLANDRLYIHGYIRATGHLLSSLELPQTVASDPSDRYIDAPSKLLSWTIDALVNIRREEKFFVDTATRYGINVNLSADTNGRVPAEAKLDGLRRFEELFDSLVHLSAVDVDASSAPRVLPWLEAAVVFYGTEKCYLEAWSWAKSHLDTDKDTAANPDADGGAVRDEFIANWTSAEFAAFVDELGGIIDEAVAKEISVRGDQSAAELMQRCQPKWNQLLVAEAAFWPGVKE